MKIYDIVIVGGGIMGGSIAFELAKHKLNVAVLDRQELMHEASWAAAGMLSPAPDCPAAIPAVPLGRASLAIYPKFVDAIEHASGMRTGFRTGGAVMVISHGNADDEVGKLAVLHRGLGLACEPLPLEKARIMEPALGKDALAAAFLPEECSVEPRPLCAAVIGAAISTGVTVLPGKEVVSLALDGKKCVGVKTANGETIHASQVVLAAGCWSSQILNAVPYAPTVPLRGQMIALRHSGTPIRNVLRSERGYIVPRGRMSPQTVILGSTIENAGYEKRVTSGGLEKILAAANALVPELAKAEVIETWSGLRPGTPDQLPILGPADIEGLVFATGHYRNGILLAPITAKLVGEWIMQKQISMDCEIFSPLRFLRPHSTPSASPC
ncbi:MAG TPA: glycine oxidase ThiO [Candidatus Acidoferrales bacterium]|nr:glycine oxidase ThiO [Candidatus Acidoferrales bacterium]